jgi:ABC-type molybdate transport system substrate-binding protein
MSAAGVTVFCDPTLAPVVRQVGAQAGYEVAVLSAPAPLMVQQILRHTRNDVLFTRSDAMDQAQGLALVVAATRVDGFSAPLAVATLQGWSGALGAARVAVTDATVESAGLDGRAVLRAGGIAAGAVQGAANTGDVAFLVTSGAADAGLVYLTDVKADARLKVVAVLSGPGQAYSVAVNAHAVGPNAQAFVNLLRGSGAVLQAGGLNT